MGYKSDPCVERRNILDDKFSKTRTSILNIYNPCYTPPKDGASEGKKRWKQSGRRHILTDEMDCDDSTGITNFFNTPDIHVKLHVDSIEQWGECSDVVADNYIMFANASYWLYPKLVKELRVWIYSGDVDADVPIDGTLTWIDRFREEFGLPTEQPWREWWIPGQHVHEDQVGGMTWGLRNLTFASIKGAGHEVPRDKR